MLSPKEAGARPDLISEDAEKMKDEKPDTYGEDDGHGRYGNPIFSPHSLASFQIVCADEATFLDDLLSRLVAPAWADDPTLFQGDVQGTEGFLAVVAVVLLFLFVRSFHQ